MVDILKDRAEQDALNGRIGNSCRMTFRDLGIRRINAQALGRNERLLQAQLIEAISPQSREIAVQQMMQTVENRIGLALSTTQLVQSSLQNANNLQATGDPTALAEFQVKLNKISMTLGQEAQRGNLINSFVPDFATLLQPSISSISGALHGGEVPTTNTDREGTGTSVSKETGSTTGGFSQSFLNDAGF